MKWLSDNRKLLGGTLLMLLGAGAGIYQMVSGHALDSASAEGTTLASVIVLIQGWAKVEAHITDRA